MVGFVGPVPPRFELVHFVGSVVPFVDTAVMMVLWVGKSSHIPFVGIDSAGRTVVPVVARFGLAKSAVVVTEILENSVVPKR